MNAARRWLEVRRVATASIRRWTRCAGAFESSASRFPFRSYVANARTGFRRYRRRAACSIAGDVGTPGKVSLDTVGTLSGSRTPGSITAVSWAGVTSSQEEDDTGRRVAAPTSKYAAKRSSVADLRMRSASPLDENVGSPFSSTECKARVSRVTPSAKGSGGEGESGAERSPSSRRWIRDIVTSRLPRMVSSMPANHPSLEPEPDAGMDDASEASEAASQLVSPSSTRRRLRAACAASHRAVRSSTVSSASGSANPATTYSSSMRTTTACLPSARHGIWSVSLPTTPLRTRKGRPSALSASTFSRMPLRTMSPLNTATFRSLVLIPCTYSPSTPFSTDASFPSNMATRRCGRSAYSTSKMRASRAR